ncbi:cobalt-zinc-cadmium efflux system protein [Streptomyces umbrinus]|uniref:cation diffusion facilitator family transporter n=1 Tax=Streptomyces umbrinus TaxID=67370 RepID=UPI00167CDA1A|nr:cation diffusion facilitator family transporter [Streptomyces umbrinus]MCR3728285.1 cobalt-zinc-cadmium efflux system protein [Streptomyces umbrinus]MCX4562627.1 cation diffusion facilitator family transporter [Streptomyces phaeochromogenes]GHH35612.1 cation transporter [Streptomyces umbrinus]
MGAGHSHGHAHGAADGGGGTAAAAYRGRLRVALWITLTVMVVEIVGGIVANSLALVADAAHMATDALGLAMALLAIHFAGRPPSGNRTFGYARAEILAALANCLLLLGVGGYVLYEAIQRFVTPTETEGGLTAVFGLIGLVANMISLSLLMRGQKESLNVRGAFLEVAADALGSLAVLVSAVLVLTTGWQAADPVASIVIGLMIVPRTWKLLRETLNVLLEAAPEDVDMAAVRSHIRALPGVEGVHDLHAWTITSGLPVLSAHVVVGAEALDTIGHEKMLHELRTCLGDHFDVEHCTFQLEPDGHAAHELRVCH